MPPPTVAEAMVTDVKLTAAGATVGDLQQLFADEHVHAAVVVEGGLLLGVVDRDDLEGALAGAGDRAGRRARDLARWHARVVGPDADLEDARALLLASGRRRLAVASPDGSFHGLLCLKSSRSGFCSDADVRSRACS